MAKGELRAWRHEGFWQPMDTLREKELLESYVEPGSRSLESLVMTDAIFWAGRRVLVTGHTGFKGAWLSLWLETPRVRRVVGLALPPEKHARRLRRPCPMARPRVALVDLRDAGTSSSA